MQNVRLIASDVRQETVDWCKANLPGIDFYKNELKPPLEFIMENSVDIVIAQSVFTHIPLDWQQAWLQEVIASDPSILGVGDVILKDRERIHPGAGRLDLLLQEADGHGRFEVEIQLGQCDESHPCRTQVCQQP